MIAPVCHELEAMRQRVEFLEVEHARLVEVTRLQADMIGGQRRVLRSIACTEPHLVAGAAWIHWREQARRALG